MKKVFILIAISGTVAFADTVITLPFANLNGITTADHTRLYQVTTASANGWPGWYIDSIKVDSLVADTTGGTYIPANDTFTLRIYNSSFNQIGSDYSATAVSGFTVPPLPTGWDESRGFSVTFNLPYHGVQVAGSSSFFYSVESSSMVPTMWTRSSEPSSYAAGWGIGTGYVVIGGTIDSSLGSDPPALTLNATLVPEPSALSLLAVGLGGLAVIRRYRK